MTDVDLDRGTLTIHNSKRRSRIVPIRNDLVSELRHYINDRRQLFLDRRCEDSGAFFVRRNGTPIPVGSASDAIRHLLRDLKIKPALDGSERVLMNFVMPSLSIA